jgi:diaminopimelate epimerase
MLRKIKFYKYHGTGNDFIVIDNRSQKLVFGSAGTIAELCHRRFGIGADGLILLEDSGSFDFLMKYYNADGKEGSMCGNGGRCIVSFSHFLGITGKKCTFEAIDGIHRAEIRDFQNGIAVVALKMNDVIQTVQENRDYIMNTGSPHYVKFCNETDSMDVVTEGKKIRYDEPFKTSGINVNFVSQKGDIFKIRTYERGVEDETLSCGTGTVAAAIAVEMEGKAPLDGTVKFETKGGQLEVTFQRNENLFTNIWLIGPAVCVYEGIIELKS